MLFTDELARRGVRAIAVDPGGADTNISRYSTGLIGFSRELGWPRNFPQTAKTAAQSSIIGVTEDLPAGTYLAPVFKQFGRPRVTKRVKKTRDPDTAARLWQLSADLTECDWSR
jgi:NAD(P)-dependent dehydrogenase (short-subunit alcohol dehydrogenase family)